VEREQVLEILQGDITYAKRQLDGATRAYDDVVREIPGMLPHSDGIQRIKNVSRDLASSRVKMHAAIERVNAFVVHGIIPDDLQRKPSQKEGGDWRTRSSSARNPG
jgi:hypothetical protein